MSDAPGTQHHEPERGRLGAKGRRTDDGDWCTLLAVHEADGSWTVRGPGGPG